MNVAVILLASKVGSKLASNANIAKRLNQLLGAVFMGRAVRLALFTGKWVEAGCLFLADFCLMPKGQKAKSPLNGGLRNRLFLWRVAQTLAQFVLQLSTHVCDDIFPDFRT